MAAPHKKQTARDEAMEEWLEVVEDEYIAQGDISPSETADGHDPSDDLDDDDVLDNEITENMHEEDEE